MTERIDLDDLLTVIPRDRLSLEAEEIERHCYDASPLAAKWRRQGQTPLRPDLIAIPRDDDEVAKLLVWANEHAVAVTPWGAGSAVTGAPLAQGGISLDLSAMDRTLEVNTVDQFVRVEAGKMGHHLEAELNQLGFTLNHSPQSLERSTVGGWLSTRASGQFSSRWGSIEDLCISCTAVLPDGQTITTPHTPRAAVGPDLRHLFIGAEGAMGVITEVNLKIFELPETRLFECLKFPELHDGLEAMRVFMGHHLRPFLVRLYDADESSHAMHDDEFAAPVMFVGCEGLDSVAGAEMAALLDICHRHGGQALGREPVEAWMQRRFDFSAVENILDTPGGLAETIEVAHFWSEIETTYEMMKTALGPHADHVLGHFSHAYAQGTSLYLILLGQAADDAAAAQTLNRIWDVAMQTALQCGAAISHHHGIGYVRRNHVAPYLGSGLELIRRMKYAVDPNGILNPGKMTAPP